MIAKIVLSYGYPMVMLWLSSGAGFTMRLRIPYSVLTGSFGIVFISGAKVQKIIGICKFLNIGNTKMYKKFAYVGKKQ